MEHDAIAVIDVGANPSVTSDQLLQFAHMGIAYQKSRGIDHPKVGLLNIGSEATKGTPLLREAYQKLQELPHFVGNVEGRNALRDDIDVLVTDGFTGNVFLKTAEGIAKIITEELAYPSFEDISDSSYREALALLRHHLNYADYPGALLCGVDGIVMKCHGEVTTQALKSTVIAALRLVNHHFPQE